MAILATINSKTYTPQTQVVPFTVAANVAQVIVTLTHANTLAAWPAGPLLQIFWRWGIGDGTGTFQTGGGVTTLKNGSPDPAAQATTFGTTKPPNVTSGTVTVTNLQTLTAAVLVEGF